MADLAEAARNIKPTDIVVDGRGARWYEVPIEQIDNLRAALAAHDAERKKWVAWGAKLLPASVIFGIPDPAELERLRNDIEDALATAAAEQRAKCIATCREIERQQENDYGAANTGGAAACAAAIEAGGEADDQRRGK